MKINKPDPLTAAIMAGRVKITGEVETERSSMLIESIKLNVKESEDFEGEVIDYLKKHPKADADEVAKALGNSPKIIAPMLKKLKESVNLYEGMETSYMLQANGPNIVIGGADVTFVMPKQDFKTIANNDGGSAGGYTGEWKGDALIVTGSLGHQFALDDLDVQTMLDIIGR